MPTPRSGLAAAAANGKLYVFGGEVPGVFAHTEEFDPATSDWRRLADMPTPRHGMAAVVAGQLIHLIGGGEEAGLAPSSAHESFRISP